MIASLLFRCVMLSPAAAGRACFRSCPCRQGCRPASVMGASASVAESSPWVPLLLAGSIYKWAWSLQFSPCLSFMRAVEIDTGVGWDTAPWLCPRGLSFWGILTTLVLKKHKWMAQMTNWVSTELERLFLALQRWERKATQQCPASLWSFYSRRLRQEDQVWAQPGMI